MRRPEQPWIADYDRATEINPKNAFALNARGNFYLDKGDFDRAIVPVRVPNRGLVSAHSQKDVNGTT